MTATISMTATSNDRRGSFPTVDGDCMPFSQGAQDVSSTGSVLWEAVE
ncbi:MAG: hypothetical protein A4E45_00852 [Methanosaeta sp. PtaB.Bin039]|nr:MAG: hypothetical protein A4E45_00852 [Methanosaeta sp. PtaB.Bin039]OPY44691.1 MAG: hypothetical protein A4E47_01382 [Methanosaeta sp. PtaU1.Bin028]